jgi:hypothetical protein
MLVRAATAVLHPIHFIVLAQHISRRVLSGRHFGRASEAFQSVFGVSPVICSDVWSRCIFIAGTRPLHLLWALLFLWAYATEPILCSMAGVSGKTFRKWVHPTVRSIAAYAPVVVSSPLMDDGNLIILTIHFLADKPEE